MRIMNGPRQWLGETHSVRMELTRHFFLRFFDSDLVSAPGQWRVVAAGLIAILLSSGILIIPAYYRKYRLLNELDEAGPFKLAAMADGLLLIAIVMMAIALMTVLQWTSLFPSLRDYLALAGLPLRPRDLFTAKFAALIVLAGAVTLAVAAPLGVLLPMMQHGKHSTRGALYILANWVATFGAGGFVFFALLALQGVLLNITPIRMAQRTSLAIQTALLGILVCAAPLLLSLPRLHAHMNDRPEWGLFVPPLWFLGLREVLAGGADEYSDRLAKLAVAGLAGTILLALATYLWSFRRHRLRLLHSSSILQESTNRAWISALGNRVVPDTRQFAIYAFIVKTLGRSGQHRLVLSAFTALALALIFDGFVSLAINEQSAHAHSLALRHAAVSAPLALFLFILAGLRYLFRMPVELRANWIFRINEQESRTVYLTAVQRFMVTCGVIPVALGTLPLELAILGPSMGSAAFVLTTLVGLVLTEAILLPIERIPFTSSYIPGRRPVVETLLLYGISVAAFVSVLSGMIVLAVTQTWPFIGLALALVAVLWKLHAARLDQWSTGRLEFEESLEPAVLTLGIDRD